MRKFLKYIIVLSAAAVLFPGCNKWLDIEPEYEIVDDDLFKNTAGYYKTINGIYQTLSGGSLYGMGLSWGAMEAWAHTYRIVEEDHPALWSLYNREYSTENALAYSSSFWGMYNCIAQVNDVIAKTEEAGPEFFDNDETDYNVILGEAYALRGMMHFDLCRLFAKAPSIDDGAYIPYVETYPAKVNPPVATSTVLAKAIRDLEKGRELVAKHDLSPEYMDYMFSTLYRYNNTVQPSDLGLFFSNRGCRLNYLAITTLLARVNLYAGNTTEAETYAKEIIGYAEGTSGDSRKKLSFTAASDVRNNQKMTDDLLFSFYNEKLIELAEPYYSVSTGGANKALQIDDPSLRATADIADVRDYNVENNIPVKYRGTEGAYKGMLIPNIRISEAYYIAAECVYQTNMPEAAGYINTVRTARVQDGKPVELVSESADRTTFLDALTKEYRKEFFGEGQLIFYYKRRNIPILIEGGSINHQGNLVLEIPKDESAS